MNEYKIYLVNNGASKKQFWCFFAKPESLRDDPKVFANSTVSLAVEPKHRGLNSFTIPVQYVLGAGSSNKPVGLDVAIESTISSKVALRDTWTAEYFDAPPKQGPNMNHMAAREQGEVESILYKSNAFNKVQNELNSWYSSMSFGILTDAGFIGMSWSPDPDDTKDIVPKLSFFIATGEYSSSKLASFTTISSKAAEVTLKDFDNFEATVTLGPAGKWTVTPGRPPITPALDGPAQTRLDGLVQSHVQLTDAHRSLLGMVRDSGACAAPAGLLACTQDEDEQLGESAAGDTEKESVTGVVWDKSEAREDAVATDTYLSGTLSVGTALTAAFGFFVLAGVRFRIASSRAGGTSFRFSYSGTRSANAIKDLLVAGANIVLSMRDPGPGPGQ
ncbi:hypothetical protein [Massilia mucilaginosa]|uniref:hypothetical protein n=1 Tax=Massilia mucilaginosa TaxID=2609282 RepID=UPI00165296A1|nr:hypothetical protein [Massilia mucilaginosa]